MSPSSQRAAQPLASSSTAAWSQRGVGELRRATSAKPAGKSSSPSSAGMASLRCCSPVGLKPLPPWPRTQRKALREAAAGRPSTWVLPPRSHSRHSVLRASLARASRPSALSLAILTSEVTLRWSPLSTARWATESQMCAAWERLGSPLTLLTRICAFLRWLLTLHRGRMPRRKAAHSSNPVAVFLQRAEAADAPPCGSALGPAIRCHRKEWRLWRSLPSRQPRDAHSAQAAAVHARAAVSRLFASASMGGGAASCGGGREPYGWTAKTGLGLISLRTCWRLAVLRTSNRAGQ